MGRLPDKNDEDSAPRPSVPRRGGRESDSADTPPQLRQSETLSTISTIVMRSEAALLVVEQTLEKPTQTTRKSSEQSNHPRRAESGGSSSYSKELKARSSENEEQKFVGNTLQRAEIDAGASSLSNSSRSKSNKKKEISSSLSKTQKDFDIEKGSLVEDNPDRSPQTAGLHYATTEEIAAIPTSLRTGQRLQVESTPGAQRVGGQNGPDRIDSINTLGGNTTVASQEGRDILLEAEIVQPEPHVTGPFVMAKPMEEDTTDDTDQSFFAGVKRHRWKVAFGVLVVTGLVLALAIVLEGRNGDSGSAPSFIPAAPTVISPSPDSTVILFIAALPEFLNKRSEDALMDPNSAQSRAVVWLESLSNVHNEMANDRLLQRYALASLYYSTDGQGWTNNASWLTDQNECDWYTTSDESPCFDNEYVNLELNNNALAGLISDDIALLPRLERLDFGTNSLNGFFLESKMENLSHINLENNYFTGTLLARLLQLSRLKELDISSNSLTGGIPAGIGSLTNLEVFACSDNPLNGSIATEIGLARSLVFLELSNCGLSNSIPTELGNLSLLEHIFLDLNNLGNSIPSQIWALASLEELYLNDNILTGSIPTNIEAMTGLRDLTLENNILFGTIPTQIGRLTNLELLTASFNFFSGSVPSELGNLVLLQQLILSDNNIEGSIPVTLGMLNQITNLQLHVNYVSALIPSEMGKLTDLVYLTMDDNLLSGAIPSEIGNLINVKIVYFHNNDLVAPIPSVLGQLTKLEQLTLYNNTIIDTMPQEVCALIEEHQLLSLPVDCEIVQCGCCQDSFDVPCSSK